MFSGGVRREVGGLGFLGLGFFTVPLEDRRMGAEERTGRWRRGEGGDRERGRREKKKGNKHKEEEERL